MGKHEKQMQREVSLLAGQQEGAITDIHVQLDYRLRASRLHLTIWTTVVGRGWR